MKWNSLGYLAGLTSLNFIPSAEWVAWQIFLPIAFILLYWFCSNRLLINQRYSQILRFLVSFSVGLLLAAASAQMWLSYSQKIIDKPQIAKVEGSICSIPIKSNDITSRLSGKRFTMKFDFCTAKINGQKLTLLQNSKLKLSYYRIEQNIADSLSAGTSWQFEVKLKPNYGRLNPAGFDYEKWLLSEGYLATGYVKKSVPVESGFTVKNDYHSTRQSIYNAVTRVAKNQNTRGVVLALSMGERAEIDPLQWRHIVNSGTAHLLAISGLHIGIAALWGYHVFLLVLKRVRWVTRQYSAQRLAEIASLMSALIVTLVSGLGYPSQRALIMLSIFLIARWSGRHLSLANLLSLSVIVITILQPFAVMSLSFWLSVYAVAIIALAVSYKQQTNLKLTKIKAWLRLNWLLFVGLIPITWWFFAQFALIGFFANVLLIPLTTFISAPLIYIGLSTLLISDELALHVFYLVEHSITLTLWLQQKMATFNEWIPIPVLSGIGIVSLVIVVFGYLVPRSMPGKSLMLPAVLLLVGAIYNKNQRSDFKLVMFDVGHGLAISISKDQKQLVYDTGYGRSTNNTPIDQQKESSPLKAEKLRSEYSVARSSLIPYLKKQGVVHIDNLVISHNDADHSGGFLDLLENFTIGELSLGESNFIEAKGLIANVSNASIAKTENCHHQTEWAWQEVSFSFITTPSHFKSFSKVGTTNTKMPNQPLLKYRGNNASCILLIETKYHKILITGDIERQVEKSIVNNDLRQSLKGIDILVAPHHGSETSSTNDFVNHLSPNLVLFSAGYANQWQFPRPKVMQRYKFVGAKQLISYQTGAITISETSEGELKVITERQNRARFWHLKQQQTRQ